MNKLNCGESESAMTKQKLVNFLSTLYVRKVLAVLIKERTKYSSRSAQRKEKYMLYLLFSPHSYIVIADAQCCRNKRDKK